MESINGLGIFFMASSWIAIIYLNVFCFKRIFKEPEEKIVGPLEVERDIDEAMK